jgi:hypothetical protein
MADTLDRGMSRAMWNLVDPVTATNENYKPRLRVGNVVVPVTFDRISSERHNNKLIIAYRTHTVPNSNPTLSPFDVQKALDLGCYFTVEIPIPIAKPDTAQLLKLVNEQIAEQMYLLDQDWLQTYVSVTGDNGHDGYRIKDSYKNEYRQSLFGARPVLMYDRSVKVDLSTPTDGDLYKIEADLTSSTYIDEDTVNNVVKQSYGQLMNSGTSGMCWEWRKLQPSPPVTSPTVGGRRGAVPSTYDPIFDTTTTATTSSDYATFQYNILDEFAIITDANALRMPVGLSFLDLRLNHVLGFPRTIPNQEMVITRDTQDPYKERFTRSRDIPISAPGTIDASISDTIWTGGNFIRRLIRAPRQPDYLGTRFIKIMTNLKVLNIDPNTKDLRNVLAVVPVTNNSDDIASGLYYVGSTQSPQYYTLAEPIIDKIELWLEDDHGFPINMYADWFVQLDVDFEEPELTDPYRSYKSVTDRPAHNFHMKPSSSSYRQFYDQAMTDNSNLEQLESAERVSDMGRGKRTRNM